MKNTLTYASLGILSLIALNQQASAQQTDNLSETTDGLVMKDGKFYATFSIQGMTYNTNTQSYELPSSGGGGGNTLPPYTPIFDINDPAAVSAAIANLGNVRSDSATYTDYIKSLSAALDAPGADTAAIQAALFAELKDAASYPRPNEANLGNDWSRLSFDGKSIAGWNLMGTSITGEQLKNMTSSSSLIYANLSGLNLAGLDWSTKSAQGINFTGCTNLDTASLNNTINIAQAKFVNIDLSGFNPTGKDISSVYFDGVTGGDFSGIVNQWAPNDTIPRTFKNSDASTLNLSGKTIQGRDFSNSTGLTAEKIATSSWAADSNLTGTGITPEALRAAVIASGGNPADQKWSYITYTDGVKRATP